MSFRDRIKSVADAEKAMVELRAFHAPKLDAFRVEVRTLRTTDLLSIFEEPNQLLSRFDDSADTDLSAATLNRIERTVSAALVAVFDEIDRRIPIPG